MKKGLFLVIILITTTANAQNLDIDILRKINSQEIQSSDKFFKFVTESNSEIVVAVPLTLGIIGLVNKDQEMLENAAEIILANGVNVIITYALKFSIDRDRPFDTYPDIRQKASVDDASFPSGHTSSSFATATTLSLEYPKWYVIVPAYTWASTVAYSRMHLGVHYPSDILGGIITGVGSSYVTYKANKWLKSKYGKKKLPQ